MIVEPTRLVPRKKNSAIGHIGLASMRERAELIGGRLAIESTDEGTEVRVEIRIDEGEPPRPRRRFRGAREGRAISD